MDLIPGFIGAILLPLFIFSSSTAAVPQHHEFNIAVSVVEREILTNSILTGNKASELSKAIVSEAWIAGFDPLFVLAVMEIESGFHTKAVSTSDAKGLMQMKKSTFREFSKPDADIYDPVANARAGIRYLEWLSKRFVTCESMLMAYNLGPGAATAYFKLSPDEQKVAISYERQAYPSKVIGAYKKILKRNGLVASSPHKSFKRLTSRNLAK